MVEWFRWDSSLISTTNWFPSVLWHCWFGHLASGDRPWGDLLCVEWYVKPYTVHTHSLTNCLWHWVAQCCSFYNYFYCAAMRAYITGSCLLSVVQLSSVMTASTQCRRHRRRQSWSRQSLGRLLTVPVNRMLTYHHSHRYCHGPCQCYYWFNSPSLIGHYLGFFCSWVTF